MKTLLITLLLSISIFGQGGGAKKSVLTQAQKDSIGAMISDSLANFTSGLDTSAVEDIAGQVASDSIAQYTLSPTYQPSFILGSGGLWNDYNKNDFLDSLGVVTGSQTLIELYNESYLSGDRRLGLSMVSDTAKIYTQTNSTGGFGAFPIIMRAFNFDFYTSLTLDSINSVNYLPLRLSQRGNVLINGAADVVGTYGAMVFKNITGNEPVGADANSKLYNYGGYLKVRDGTGISMKIYHRITQVSFDTSGTRSITFADDFITALNENDDAYKVFVTGNVNETFWITNKTALGFTINSSNASSIATVDIEVRR